MEAELDRLLGITKVIWLPGIAGRDITDGHTDFYARFASPGAVIAGLDNDPRSFDYDVTRRHLDILHSATDAHDRPLQVDVIDVPATVREKFDNDDFAAGYINFYVCNGAVIALEHAPTSGEANSAPAARIGPIWSPRDRHPPRFKPAERQPDPQVLTIPRIRTINCPGSHGRRLPSVATTH